MLAVWNLYLLLLPLTLPPSIDVVASTGDNAVETKQLDAEGQDPPLQGWKPKFQPDLLRPPWSFSLSSEEIDRQGVIGEYADLQEATETSLSKAKISNSAESTQYFTSRHPPLKTTPSPSTQAVETSITRSTILDSTTTTENPFILPSSQDDGIVPFILTGSLLPNTQEQEPSRSAGPGFNPTSPGGQGWTPVPSQGGIQEGGGVIDSPIHIRVDSDLGSKNDDTRDNGLYVSKSSGTLLPNGDMDTTATPCKTTNQTWTPKYPDDLTPTESLRPSLALNPAFYVPLYSDWNSALATWGLAWEAHIYGLGSIFTVFGLISVVSLLGLPLCCPPGSAYFALLHLFLVAFAGIQAFCLLYDAYSHQDRLPPIGSLLLTELPLPCLISAFSLAFLLLSLRSRMRLSLPLAISTSFSLLPKPLLLLCLSLLHFGVTLGCVGLLQLFHVIPVMILLVPHGLFVILTIFLSLSYLIFYCLLRIDTKHIYRLNDNVENGGSPEVVRSPSCPFSRVEDWHRAAGAGVGAALCLLGCGGLQLYGILHALGLGGVDGYGFQPWSWWGYQISCRLCEAGVCLGLSLIGTHPLFCPKNSSIKTITNARPGSWSRLSYTSPSRGGLNLSAQEDTNPPVFSSHDCSSQSKQEKLVVCNVISKAPLEALPLGSVVDHPENGIECLKPSQVKRTLLPLPTPPIPPYKSIKGEDSQLSSLDSLGREADSTVDLQPPSPIDLSRSIDQALFNESLFSHSIFGLPRLSNAFSSHSLNSPSHGALKQGPSSLEKALYRTSSCGDVDQEKISQYPKPQSSSTSHGRTPEQWDWKGSVSGSTQGLCGKPGKVRSHSWANRGQNFTQHSLPRAIPQLSCHRRYRTLSLASQDSRGSGRLGGTKQLSESKQLEWDLAVQAEFVTVCRQIDALSVCSDTIDL